MENSISIIYEFKPKLENASYLTGLLTGEKGHREVRLQGDISPESFALACRYLSGDEITISGRNADDLKILGHELKCPSLVKMVEEFEKKTATLDLTDIVNEVKDRTRDAKVNLFVTEAMSREIKEICKIIPELVSDYKMEVLDDLHLTHEVDFNSHDKICPHDFEFLKGHMDRLSLLMSDIKQAEKASAMRLQFEITQKEKLVSSLSESLTFDEVNDFLREKAVFGESWCQFCLGKRLDQSSPELAMKYLLSAAGEGRVIDRVQLAKMYISGTEIQQNFKRALECLRVLTGKGEKSLFNELSDFISFISSTELGCITKGRFGRVIDYLDTFVVPSCVSELANRCFKDCVSLKEVRFDEGTTIQHMKRQWFTESSVEIIHIPDAVVELEDECFRDCNSLCCVSFSSRSCLKRIGDEAFAGCLKLNEFEIPSNVVLGSKWWKGSSLAHISFANGSNITNMESD